MAKESLTIQLTIHWIDKWFYIPYLKFLHMLGFEVDVEKALEPMINRMKMSIK